jgi:hypothetical protein
LHESVLFGLLTHQLKATDCYGLDGSDHPLKVAARVRIPYGLPSNPRSEAVSPVECDRTEGGLTTGLLLSEAALRSVVTLPARGAAPSPDVTDEG